MKDLFKHLHGSTIDEALNGGRPRLTAKQFLGKEDGPTYFAPEELVKFAKTLRPQELEQLGEVVLGMKEGYRIVGNVAKRTDKGGRKYTYLNTNMVNATVGNKFILEAGMVKFLKDYMDGKFVAGFTLEELVEEALNV